jgi:hypothetical protein
MLASAGTFLHTGLKVPYFIWFGKNHCARRPGSARRAALEHAGAMALTSFLCIFIGCYTPYLYRMLPYAGGVPSVHLVPRLRDAPDPALHRARFLPAPQEARARGQDQPRPRLVLPQGRPAFLWLSRRPVQAIDNGSANSTASAASSRSCCHARLSAVFDNASSTARSTASPGLPPLGGRLRGAQRGALQENLTVTFGARGPWSCSLLVPLTPSRDDDPSDLTTGLPLLSVLIFSPLVAAAGRRPARARAPARWWTLLCTTVIAILSLPLWWRFNPTAAFQFASSTPGFPSEDQLRVGVDGISLLLVLLTTLIMPLCVLASWNYIKKRVKEFMICLLVMETAMIGVFCALDAILFFVFWEAMLIPMALLIGVWGGPRRIYAALKFFIYTMAGSVFLLVALIALRLKTGSFGI